MSDSNTQFDEIDAIKAELESLKRGFESNIHDFEFGNADIIADGFDPSLFTFGCTNAGLVVTVRTGNVSVGSQTWVVAEATKTLSGAATEYIHVQLSRVGSAPTIEQNVGTLPQSDSSYFRVPLVKCTVTAGVASISQILHIGDIHYDTPLR